MNTVNFELEKYILPAFYAAMIINDDWTGATDEDQELFNKWHDKVKPGYCIDADTDNTYFAHGNDMQRNMGADVCEFTFRKEIAK